MKKNKLSALMALMVALIVTIVPYNSIAQTTLKFGHAFHKDHPYYDMALKFKEELEKRSKTLRVDLFPACQLGNERDLLEGLQIGSVDISVVTSALVADFIRGFRALHMPFLIRDAQHLLKVMDGETGDMLAQELQKYGFIKLGYCYSGSRNLFCRRPVRSADKLQGLKIGTAGGNKILTSTWEAFGATVVLMSPNDIQPALLKGRVDAVEGTIINYKAMKLYEVAPYLVKIMYAFDWHNFLMSGATWEELSEKEKQDVLGAARSAQDHERTLYVKTENDLLEELQADYGIDVFVPGDIEQWKIRTEKIYETYTGDAGGPDYIEVIKSL